MSTNSPKPNPKTPAERKDARIKKGSKPTKTVYYGGNEMEPLNQACDENPHDEDAYLVAFVESLVHPTIEGEIGPSGTGEKPIITFPRTYGDVNVDLNPQLYPSREERKSWSLETYEQFLSQTPDLLTKSLDEVVMASKSIFYDDYFELLQKSWSKN